MLISWISSWIQGIVIAVIIATIIEMILPEGNNKKYIKVVIGVYILFTLIAPVITKFTDNSFDFDFNKYVESIQTSSNSDDIVKDYNSSNIEKIYTENLKEDIKNRLNEKGYELNKISLELDFNDTNNYGKIVELNVNVSKNKNINSIVEQVEVVEININNTTKVEEDKLTQEEVKEIKEYLSNIYEIDFNIIKIN